MITLVPATENDLDFIVKMDGEARKSSVGVSFSANERVKAREAFARRLNEPDRYECLLIKEQLLGIVGMVIIDYRPEPIIELPIGDPFRVSSEIQPQGLLSREDIIDLMGGGRKDLRKASISSMAVSEDCRGKGIGKETREQLLERFKDKGVGVVMMDAGLDNTAILRLFKNFTFVKMPEKFGYEPGKRLLGISLIA